MGPRAGLDRCGKSRLHRDSIPEPLLYRLRYPDHYATRVTTIYNLVMNSYLTVNGVTQLFTNLILYFAVVVKF